MSTAQRPYHTGPTLQPPSPHPTPAESDLTKTAMDDFHQLFSMFDMNHNGTIQYTEFQQILRMLDDAPSGKTLETMLRIACDIPSTQPIPTSLNFDQFMRFFAVYKQDTPVHVTDAEIFHVLDQDSGGTVSVPELGSVLGRFGMRVSEDEASAMADFATPLPGMNDISLADIVDVGEHVRRLRQSSVVIHTSDTSEDEDDNPTSV